MKGIMFTEPLFHKVVKGEKTQTRRIIAPQPFIKNDWFIKEIDGWKNAPYAVVEKYENCEPERYEIHQLLKPKYKVGEIVYLKEPHILYDEQNQELRTNASGIQFAYKYGNNIPIEEITGKSDSKWSNKLFMPASAARHFIKITAVRAERLQDISEEDCFKEGIEYSPEAVPIGYPFGAEFPYNNGFHNYTTAKEAYAALIDKINGKGTWESNPWVWIYSFILIR